MKRLEARARSPAYAHVSETMTGIITVRTFQKANSFLEDFYNFQDNHTSCSFIFRYTERFLNTYLGLIGIAFLATMMFTLLALADGNM